MFTFMLLLNSFFVGINDGIVIADDSSNAWQTHWWSDWNMAAAWLQMWHQRYRVHPRVDWWYHLVICYSLLLNMAIEIVSFPIAWWFSIVMLVYQRVRNIIFSQYELFLKQIYFAKTDDTCMSYWFLVVSFWRLWVWGPKAGFCKRDCPIE